VSRGKQTSRFIGFPTTACSEWIGVVLHPFRQASMKAVNLAESAGIYSEIVDSFGLETLQVSVCVRTHLRVCKCSYPKCVHQISQSYLTCLHSYERVTLSTQQNAHEHT